MTLPQEYLEHNQLETIRMGMRASLDDDFLSRVNIETTERALYDFGRQIGFQFKADIWADKVADDVIEETQDVKMDFVYDEWGSAWQLWKYNHWNSWWFTYLGFLFFCSTPQRTEVKRITKKKRATLKFRVCKYQTFPDFNPETYPGQFGRSYRYIKQDSLGLK
jgi:hypothetical protein